MTVELENHPYKQLEFPAAPHGRPYVGVTMVMSVDGKITVGGELTPGSLGSGFDRFTMTVIRSHFDAVICGAETIRQHPYYLGVTEEFEPLRTARGQRTQPLTIIVTGSGNLPMEAPLFIQAPQPPVILTSEEHHEQVSKQLANLAEVIAVGSEKVEIPAALAYLRNKLGIERLLLEGGPRLNYQFLHAEAVDEIFLTLAPRLVGSEADLTMVMGSDVLDSLPRLELISHFQHKDELFLRYRVPPKPRG